MEVINIIWGEKMLEGTLWILKKIRRARVKAGSYRTVEKDWIMKYRTNKTRVESVKLGKTSKRLWSCQTLIFVLSIIFYKEKNNSWVKKNFWVQKLFWVKAIFWVKKNSGSYKFFGSKIFFGLKQFFGSKIFFGSKKLFGSKNYFGSKQFFG